MAEACMISTLLLGAAVGGIAAFVWGAISWMMLPWHHSTFLKFTNEDAVARSLLDNCPAAGIYGFPAPPKFEKGMTAEQRNAIEAESAKQLKTGPLIMAIVQRTGYESIGGKMISALIIYAVASLAMSWLLIHTTGLSLFERAAFVSVAGLAGAIICRVTDWNWHGYSTSYAVVSVADVVVGWFLTGLAIGAVVH